MAETETSQTDIGRIWNICDGLDKQYHKPIDDLAHAIATDFHAALAQMGIPVYEPSVDGSGCFNTQTYLLAVSRLLDVLGGFHSDLSFACLFDAPEPKFPTPGWHVTAHVPDGGR